MTEERFGMIKSEISGLYVIVDEQKEYSFGGIEDEYDCMRIVNVLNSLYDMRIENGKIASAYLKENEQLKESNERFSKTVAEQIIMIKEYREENEQLKRENKTLADGLTAYFESKTKRGCIE